MLRREEKFSAAYPRRFLLMFVSACMLMLFVWLIYFTLTKHNDGTATQTQPSWNIQMPTQETTIHMQQGVTISPKIQRNRKIVLLWNSKYDKKDWLKSTEEFRCPVSDCDVTSNRSLLPQSSALILHWYNTSVHDLPNDCIPSENVQCPLWVLFNNEPPQFTSRRTLERLEGKVHWTATYRTDSDVHAPYGKMLTLKGNSSFKHDYNPDKRLVCWLVSNCKTKGKREIYVQELKQHIEVDIYGRCYGKRCPYKYRNDCYDWLSSRCKFYLSFENSICREYVTEKLFNALVRDMVPVVMGNASNYDFLPERSYINAFDFPSPKELAKYLIRVGNDEELYMSYFWWRKWYEFESDSHKWFCDMCAKLHNTDNRDVIPHRNLTWWWYGLSHCTSYNRMKNR